jgi:hypothetical protein
MSRYRLLQLFNDYGSEVQSVEAPFNREEPNGFAFLVCCCGYFCSLTHSYYCHRYHHQPSVTSNTIFEYSNLSLTTFLSLHLITQFESPISVLSLKRQISVF